MKNTKMTDFLQWAIPIGFAVLLGLICFVVWLFYPMLLTTYVVISVFAWVIAFIVTKWWKKY